MYFSSLRLPASALGACKVLLLGMMLALIDACADERRDRPPDAPTAPTSTGASFLAGTLRAWPRDGDTGDLALTDPRSGRVAVYDSALVLLALLRMGQRERAGRVLHGLAALQGEDGRLPFSFSLPAPDPGSRYERAGAIAWAGYAAVEYLDAERGGSAREVALTFAHRAAAYLLERQVAKPGDPRDGLVRGGVGNLRYEVDGDTVREVLEPGEVEWASVEHNVDSYFFLRALARVAQMPLYARAADRIARALLDRAWSGADGQFVSGVSEQGADRTLALDCASWGSILLGAVGDRARADTALAVAQARYATADATKAARGHRPYARGPLFDDERLMRHFAARLAAASWEQVPAVWPEGSAGVALAAWRAGQVEQARAILDRLELLRSRDGSLPTSTAEVPFLLDTRPSIAGTAWVELVRFELDRPVGNPTLWPP